MLDSNLLTALYSKRQTVAEFNWDNLFCPAIYSMMTEYQIERLYNVASSIRYAGNIQKKEAEIKSIMEPLGFRRLAAGTNRLVYTYLENKDFLVKIAIDKTGMRNTPDEFRNQVFLKPFVTKCFEYHPSGVIGTFERVMPITNVEEFRSVWDDIFEVILSMIGEYIIEDIGTLFFMNWSIRKNFGPVLCDYPEVFKLDGNKLFCTKPVIPGQRTPVCGGSIDYDNGFNYLICTTCGKQYKARDISKAIQDKLLIMKGDIDMRVQLVRGNEVLADSADSGTDTIRSAEVVQKKTEKRGKIIVSRLDIAGTEEEVPVEPTNDAITLEIAKAMEGVDMSNPAEIKAAAMRLAAERCAARNEQLEEKPEELKDEPVIEENEPVEDETETQDETASNESVQEDEQPNNIRVKPSMPGGNGNIKDF